MQILRRCQLTVLRRYYHEINVKERRCYGSNMCEMWKEDRFVF